MSTETEPEEFTPLVGYLGPRFVQLTRQWVNAEQVVLVVADTDDECTLWLGGGHTVTEPSPAAEVVARLSGEGEET